MAQTLLPMTTPTPFLDNELEKIKTYLPYLNTQTSEVSQASVGWHLSHSIIVIDKIYEVLKTSNPTEYQSNFNLKRAIAFRFNYFPRGVAKSPKSVLPPEHITADMIEQQIVDIRKKLQHIDQLDPHTHFTHFIFGQCDLKATKAFLEAHTRHHLKIVRDIVKQTNL